jgi:hypothetical protein
MNDDTTWYIDPLGDSTMNSIIAKHVNHEDECLGQMCADGVRRDLWRCTHDLVTRLRRLEQTVCHLHYCVYRKRGPHGKIEEWKFEKSTRKIKSTTAFFANQIAVRANH